MKIDVKSRCVRCGWGGHKAGLRKFRIKPRIPTSYYPREGLICKFCRKKMWGSLYHI